MTFGFEDYEESLSGDGLKELYDMLKEFNENKCSGVNVLVIFDFKSRDSYESIELTSWPDNGCTTLDVLIETEYPEYL